jgi:hypothetical protein
MRMLQRVIIGVAMIFFLVLPSVGSSAEWVYFTSAADGSHETYYDNETIIGTPKQTLKVWTKWVWSESGKKGFISLRVRNKMSVEGFEKLSHTTMQYELNCNTREERAFSTTHYDINGTVIRTMSGRNPTWDSISPDSIVESLFKEVCVKPKKK